MFAVGDAVAGYLIEQVIATGATGTVYLAKHPNLPRRDALKVLSADLSRDSAFRERFIREADIASLLDHPNIVSIHDRGEAEGGHLWIAMQYVAGTDAEAALQAGAMTPARAIRIVSEVAKALDYAHQHNVVHHDVKPGNILLSNGNREEEHVLLGDFGVARAVSTAGGSDGATEDSTLAVTLAYAAPEVITGTPVDGQADIYSLACTLFRLLTGRQPFYGAEGTAAVAHAHLHQPPPRISDLLPAATRQLDVVMARALAKNPRDRFSSAREFAAAAAEASASLTERTPPAARQVTPAGQLPANRSEPTTWFRNAVRKTATWWPPRMERPAVIVWSVFAVIALIAAVLWAKLLWPSSSPSEQTSPPTSTTTPSQSPEAAALVSKLPPGYPRGACVPTPTNADSTAEVACGPNADPGGPTSSIYTLRRDRAALREGLADVVSRSDVMICPPNIQSPGPWRRNDSPSVVRGTLFCGIQDGEPLVAWTNEEDRLLGVVRAEQPGATLDGLYRWWSSHS